MARKRQVPISYIEPNWNDPHVRDDVMLQVNFRMPERLMLKIDWISAMEGTSKRECIEQALTQYAAKMLAKHNVKE